MSVSNCMITMMGEYHVGETLLELISKIKAKHIFLPNEPSVCKLLTIMKKISRISLIHSSAQVNFNTCQYSLCSVYYLVFLVLLD